MTWHIVSPAYDRDYKSKAEASLDWLDGKDFVYENIGPDMGRYVSRKDLPKGSRVEIRYNKKQRLVVIENP